MCERLEGKNALITGGSRGIGLAIAVEYAREAAGIALLSKSRDRLDRAAGEVREEAAGAEVVTACADISDRAQVESAVGQIIEELGHVDILVTSAGIASLGAIDEMPPDEWESMVKVNLM